MSGDLERSDRPVGSEPLAPRRGIDRRTLVKRAAAAGALAWTAPVILDSLASPAAAASCGKLFRIEYRMNASCASVETTTVGDTGQRPSTCGAGVITNPPAGYTESITTVTSTGQSLAAGGLKVSGSCAATSSSSATFEFTGSAPSSGVVSGCSGPLSFLAAGIFSQNKTAGTGACQTRTLGDANPGLIPTLTNTQVIFTQPSSDKAAQSGDWQFVIGCACTS